MTAGPFRDGLLAGEHVLVTGGGTGLGAAMAAQLAALGAAVTVCGRRRDPLEQTAAALVEAGGTAQGIRCDVRKRERIAAMLDEAEEGQGPVTRLVNNAAGNFLAESETLEPKGFEAVMAIVMEGGWHATQLCGQRWIERGSGGAVLSIGTGYAETGGPFVLPSSMAKAALVNMTKTLATEWGRHGIRLNVISPGPIPTKGAWTRLMPDPTFEQRMIANIPLGRFVTQDELSQLAAFLLCDASAMITGQVVELDGGARFRGGASFHQLLDLPDEQRRGLFAAMRPKPRPPAPDADG